MIVHVVMFKFLDKNKQQNISDIKNKLQSLQKHIKTIVTLEVGVDINRSSRAYDMCLIVKFKTQEDLKCYAEHPKHLEVLESIRGAVEDSKVVDYLTDV